jgi:hypothetical protein
MDRGRVEEGRGSMEADGCLLTIPLIPFVFNSLCLQFPLFPFVSFLYAHPFIPFVNTQREQTHRELIA